MIHGTLHGPDVAVRVGADEARHRARGGFQGGGVPAALCFVVDTTWGRPGRIVAFSLRGGARGLVCKPVLGRGVLHSRFGVLCVCMCGTYERVDGWIDTFSRVDAGDNSLSNKQNHAWTLPTCHLSARYS